MENEFALHSWELNSNHICDEHWTIQSKLTKILQASSQPDELNPSGQKHYIMSIQTHPQRQLLASCGAGHCRQTSTGTAADCLPSGIGDQLAERCRSWPSDIVKEISPHRLRAFWKRLILFDHVCFVSCVRSFVRDNRLITSTCINDGTALHLYILYVDISGHHHHRAAMQDRTTTYCTQIKRHTNHAYRLCGAGLRQCRHNIPHCNGAHNKEPIQMSSTIWTYATHHKRWIHLIANLIVYNYWRFRAGQRHGYFPPICPVYFHIHPYIQFHMSSIIMSPITPGGGGGPRDQAVTGPEPATTHWVAFDASAPYHLAIGGKT